MDRNTAFSLFCLLVGSAISNVWGVPVENGNSVASATGSLSAGDPGAKQSPDKGDSSKFVFSLPPFLSGPRPSSPVAFGNATSTGDVQGLFATNENSLFVMSGPSSNAIANLSSTAAYFATPINETDSIVDGYDTALGSTGGFIVTAQEDTTAYAEGEYIHFMNHGASYATGWGDSTANGTTFNPGPETGSSGSGSGWKAPPKTKPREEGAKKN